MSEDIDRYTLTKQAVFLLRGLLKAKPANNEEVSCHCPFHKDKTPSMFISLKKGVYNCFSCGNSGSIESLYKDLTGENLYDVLGIQVNRFSTYAYNNIFNSQNETYIENKVDKVLVNIDWSDIIPYDKNRLSLSYVKNRGISAEVAKRYNFGYCKDSRINTTLFKNRLIIPIYEGNNLISVEGRRISGNENPKVLYPRNCSVDTLFDLDNLDQNRTLYVCEGLMDLCVLKGCKEFGNSTSIFGANLSKRQSSILSSFKDVVYIPDLDRAGWTTLKSLKNIDRGNIRYLLLPKYINGNKIKDIGDLPKAGVCVQDLVDKKWLNYIKSLDSLTEEVFNKYLTN